MNDNRKRKRDDEPEIFYQNQQGQNVQIISNANGGVDLNQPIYLNQLPVLQNQQVVYQIPQVQGQGVNSQENTYYVFIPVSDNENPAAKEENEVKSQYITYRTLGNETKPAASSVITIDGVKQQNQVKVVSQHATNHQQQPSVPTTLQPVQQVYVVDESKAYNKHPQTIVANPQAAVQNVVSPTSINNTKWKNQLYRCEQQGCDATFASLHEKKLHLETHLFPEGEQFKCNICNMVFPKAYERNKHVETHSIVPTHKCKHCLSNFPYYTSLVAHVEDAFTTEQFSCCYCQRKFDDTVTFLRHNGWSVKICKCGHKICGDVLYQKHVSSCAEAKGK